MISTLTNRAERTFPRIVGMIQKVIRIMNFLVALYGRLPEIQRTMYKTLIGSVIGVFLFLTSTLIYATLYYSTVYRGAHTVSYPVYFDYNFMPPNGAMNIATACTTSTTFTDPTKGDSTTRTDDGCTIHPSFTPPAATVDLTAGHTQWDAFDPSVLPPSRSSSYYRPHQPAFEEDENRTAERRLSSTPTPIVSVLRPSYPHFLHLSLTLPKSPVNRDLGVFMVQVRLRSSDPSRSTTCADASDGCEDSEPLPLLASSVRPAMLPYEESYVSTAKTLLMMGPTIVGGYRGNVEDTLKVEAFDRFVESGDRPLTHVEVRLITPPESTTTTTANTHRPIHVTRAELQIGREFNLVQRIMQDYFWTSAFVFIVTLTVGQASMVVFCKVLLDWDRNQRLANRSATDDGDGDGEGEENESQDEDGNAVGSGIISLEDDSSSLPPLIEDLVVVGEVTEHDGEVVVESTAENIGTEEEPPKEQKKEEGKDENDHNEDSQPNEI